MPAFQASKGFCSLSLLKEESVCPLVVEGRHNNSDAPAAPCPLQHPARSSTRVTGPGEGSESGVRGVKQMVGAELVMNSIGVGSKGICPDLPTNMILGTIFSLS